MSGVTGKEDVPAAHLGREVVLDTAERLRREEIACGVVMGEEDACSDAPVQVVSIATLTRRRVYPQADLVIIDEAQFMRDDVLEELIERALGPSLVDRRGVHHAGAAADDCVAAGGGFE